MLTTFISIFGIFEAFLTKYGKLIVILVLTCTYLRFPASTSNIGLHYSIPWTVIGYIFLKRITQILQTKK